MLDQLQLQYFSDLVCRVSDISSIATLVKSSGLAKQDDINTFPTRRSHAIPKIGLGRGLNRVPSNEASISTSLSLSLVGILALELSVQSLHYHK